MKLLILNSKGECWERSIDRALERLTEKQRRRIEGRVAHAAKDLRNGDLRRYQKTVTVGKRVGIPLDPLDKIVLKPFLVLQSLYPYMFLVTADSLELKDIAQNAQDAQDR